MAVSMPRRRRRVDERAAAVAGVDGGIGLDESSRFVSVSWIARPTPETTPVGPCPGTPEWIADRDDCCPMASADESPKVAVGSPVATILTMARSVDVSVP